MFSGVRLGLPRLIELAQREEARARALGVRIVTLDDGEYPALLREIPDPPPVLYVWGRLEPDDEVRVAVVGSRRATRHGLGAAGMIAKGLGERGIVVVSGLARGIDAAAHRGALDSPSRTIAVLGSGLARIYPREHAELAAQVAARGAVISEYPLQLGPLPHLFPRRNRVVSGLSAGTVVIEAGAVSGALVTARLALEQGRELFAVPGSILGGACEGSNGLLVEGIAHVTVSPREVLRELPPGFRLRLGLPASPLDETPDVARAGRVPSPGPEQEDPAGAAASMPEDPGDAAAGMPESPGGEGVLSARPGRGGRRGSGGPGSRRGCRCARRLPPPGAGEGAGARLDPEARAVYRLLSFDEPVVVDTLIAASGLAIPGLLAAVSRLEMAGLAVTLPGNRVARSRP